MIYNTVQWTVCFIYFFFIFFRFDENSKDFICHWYYLVNQICIPQLRERRDWYIGNLGCDFEAFFLGIRYKSISSGTPLLSIMMLSIWLSMSSGYDTMSSNTEFPLLWLRHQMIKYGVPLLWLPHHVIKYKFPLLWLQLHMIKYWVPFVWHKVRCFLGTSLFVHS